MMVCDTIEQWSDRVARIYGYRCAWPKCRSHFGLGAHHIYYRRYKVLWLVVENGVYLCARHHGLFHTIGSKSDRYRVAIRAIIGERRLAILASTFDEAYHHKDRKAESRSSEIDLGGPNGSYNLD